MVPFLPEDRLKERGALYSSVRVAIISEIGLAIDKHTCCMLVSMTLLLITCGSEVHATMAVTSMLAQGSACELH